jgi:hypothetical protein
MKTSLIFIAALLLGSAANAAGRDSNLQVLPESDYRKPLEEVVVSAQAPVNQRERLPDWRMERTTVDVAPPSTRLQWLPAYKETPESVKARSQSDEKPLFKIFEKKF